MERAPPISGVETFPRASFGAIVRNPAAGIRRVQPLPFPHFAPADPDHLVFSVLFVLCGCSEESRVASQFKEQYGNGDGHEKVTGVYVYPTKKDHRYKIEFATEWPSYTKFCQPVPKRIIPVGVKKALYGEDNSIAVTCNCSRGHYCPSEVGDIPSLSGCGEYFPYKEESLLKNGHTCGHPCKGHAVYAGTTTKSVYAYMGPDGKLYIEHGTYGPVGVR